MTEIKMKELTISIVAYNDPIEDLTVLINSVKNTSVAVDVSVVDNSQNDRLKTLSNLGITYINNDCNYGFGKGHNLVINRIIGRSKYHLILNPDITLTSGLLENLFAYMEANPDVGMIIPQVLYNDGTVQSVCKLLPTPWTLFVRRFLTIKLIKDKLNKYYELKMTDPSKAFEPPVISGCFMFIRNSVLKDIGGFDERFFMYMEDVDLCRRIKSKSKILYYPKIKVFHGHAKGSYKNLRLLKYHMISAIKYFNKWGWFLDRDRTKINRETLAELGY